MSEWHKLGICHLVGRFLCLHSSDLRSLVGSLSHATKARQEPEKSLNFHFITSFVALETQLIGNVQLYCSFFSPHLINQQPIFSSHVSKLTL